MAKKSKLNKGYLVTVKSAELTKGSIDRDLANAIIYNILTGKQKVKKPVFNPITKNVQFLEVEPDYTDRINAYDKLCKRFGWYAPKSMHVTGDNNNTLKITFVDPPPKPVTQPVNLSINQPIINIEGKVIE